VFRIHFLTLCYAEKKRDEEKRKNEEADRLIREELEREEAELSKSRSLTRY
jgi:hypothetical protein